MEIRIDDLKHPLSLPCDRCSFDHGYEPTTVQRAEVAKAVLRSFIKDHEREDEARTAIVDLVANLAHLCRLNGLELDDLYLRGLRHAEEEHRLSFENYVFTRPRPQPGD